MYDQPIIVAPKPTKAPKKKKPKAKKPKCRRKDGKKCRSKKPKCKGRRCKGKKKQKGGRRNKPRTTTAAPQHTTRPPPNDGPVTNSISIKICTRYVGSFPRYTILDWHRSDINSRTCFAFRSFYICSFCLILLYFYNCKC